MSTTNSLPEQITSFKSENSFLSNQLHNLKFQLERLTALKQQSDLNSQEAHYEIQHLQTELELAVESRNRIQQMLSSQETTITKLRTQNLELQQAREVDKKTLMALEAKIQQLNSKISTLETRLSEIHIEKTALSNELLSKSETILLLERKIKQLKQEIKQLKPLQAKLQTSGEENSKLYKEIQEVRDNFQKTEQELVFHKQRLANFEEQNRYLEESLGKEQEFSRKLKNDIERVQRQEEYARPYIQKALDLQQQVTDLTIKCESQKEATRSLEARLQEKSSEIAQGNNKLETAENKIQNKQAEIQQLQSTIKLLDKDLSEAKERENDLSRRNFEQFEEIQDKANQIDGLQKNLYESTLKTQSLTQKLANAEHQLSEERFYSAKLKDSEIQLKAYCDNLQETKDDLVGKLNNTHEFGESLRKELRDQQDYSYQANKQYNSLQSDFQSLQEQLKRQTSDLTYFEQKCDQLTEQIALEQSENKRLEERVHEIQSINQNEIRNIKHALAESDTQLKNSQLAYSTLQKEYSSQISRLEIDNVRLKDELDKSYRDMDYYRTKCEELGHNDRRNREKLQEYQHETDELRYSWTRFTEEKSRIQHDAQDLANRLQSTQSQLDKSTSELYENRRIMQEYESEIAELKMQIRKAQASTRRTPSLYDQDFDRENRVRQLQESVRNLEIELEQERLKNRDYQSTVRGVIKSAEGFPDDYDQKIEEQRTEILNLEMEQMRLREELGKTRHALAKAESKLLDNEQFQVYVLLSALNLQHFIFISKTALDHICLNATLLGLISPILYQSYIYATIRPATYSISKLYNLLFICIHQYFNIWTH